MESFDYEKKFYDWLDSIHKSGEIIGTLTSEIEDFYLEYMEEIVEQLAKDSPNTDFWQGYELGRELFIKLKEVYDNYIESLV